MKITYPTCLYRYNDCFAVELVDFDGATCWAWTALDALKNSKMMLYKLCVSTVYYGFPLPAPSDRSKWTEYENEFFVDVEIEIPDSFIEEHKRPPQ